MTQGHDIPPPDHTVPPVPPRVHNGFNSCLAAGLGTGPAAPMSVLRAALRSRGSEGSVSADQLGKRVAELGPDRNQVTTHHRDNQKRQGWEGEGRELKRERDLRCIKVVREVSTDSQEAVCN